MFRAIIVLGIAAVVAFMAGWFTIDRNSEETTIRFNRDEIRSDASSAIAKGRELLNQNQDGSDFTDESDQFAQGSQVAPDGQYVQPPYNQQQYPAGYTPPGYNSPGYNQQGNAQPGYNQPVSNQPVYNQGYQQPSTGGQPNYQQPNYQTYGQPAGYRSPAQGN